LPLALSLGIHILIGVGAVLASRSGVFVADAPVRVEVVTVVDTGCGRIVEANPSRPFADSQGTDRSPRHADDDEPEKPFLRITVNPLDQSPGSMPTNDATSTVGGNAASSGADGGNAGAGGGGSGILTAPGTARRIVYVIDRSVSMGTSGALAIAKRELLAGIAALPADAQFAVILYNRQAEPLDLGGPSDLVDATPDNRLTVARLLEDVRAEGSTDHLAALRRALAFGPEIIFFVTDADDLTLEQVRNVMLFNRRGAAIHAVELNNKGEAREDTPLQMMARLSGGSHRVVPLKKLTD
jgi:hypothetical protein